MLARVHCGLEPTITQFAHLIKVSAPALWRIPTGMKSAEKHNL
jgi:hypothetical protein